MNIILTIVLSILSILQAAGGELKQGVFYDEMEKPPVVWLADGHLHVRTTNSMRNSSMAICSSEIAVEGGEITLSAEQQLVGIGPQSNVHQHDLHTFELDESSALECSLWWLDPDGKKVSMEFTDPSIED